MLYGTSTDTKFLCQLPSRNVTADHKNTDNLHSAICGVHAAPPFKQLQYYSNW